ncbi:gcn5-related n-acetyltransferase [Stemphylium lycopersici]|uniref:Gcn5-related n-acetyltransferase n=1 Tax=Stemphylium lycopersici TaxID=183478 RepID=A0A364MYA5_STELY|nr:gcn5-related n-acetyltransferase [Stemphylium lycopersici]
MAEATPFVRQYDTSRDFHNGLHVYQETIDASLAFEPASTIGSHLWYRPYVALTPETCFVLDDGSGRVVGYCLGTAETSSFARRWRDEFTPTVDPKLVPPRDLQTGDAIMEKDGIKHFRKAVYDAECSMLQPWPETLQQYPAHLHIDILQEYQRKGWGTVLIQKFFEVVKSLGASGLHLDMVESNVKARAFYESVGFRICPQVLDGGESGRTGVNNAVMTLVKDL